MGTNEKDARKAREDAEFERKAQQFRERYGNDDMFPHASNAGGIITEEEAQNKRYDLIDNFRRMQTEGDAFDESIVDGFDQTLDELAGGDDSEPTEELERQAGRVKESRPAKRGDLSLWGEVKEIIAAIVAFLFHKPYLSSAKAAATGEGRTRSGKEDPLGVFTNEDVKDKMKKRAGVDRPFEMSSAWCGTDRMIENRQSNG